MREADLDIVTTLHHHVVDISVREMTPKERHPAENHVSAADKLWFICMLMYIGMKMFLSYCCDRATTGIPSSHGQPLSDNRGSGMYLNMNTNYVVYIL